MTLTNHGYIVERGEYVHRRVAAQMLGRALQEGEVVHHINGDGTDNRPENLRVFASSAEHLRHHGEENSLLTDDEFKTLILLGYTQKELHARGGTSRRLTRLRSELGFAYRSRGPILSKLGKLRYRKKFDYAEAQALRAEGLTYRAIGSRLGISHTQARAACKGVIRA